jgi:hypothetical protein
MLFDDVITVRPHIRESVQEYLLPHSDDDVTIGVHMRHKKPEDDGSNVGAWLGCLDQMLELFPGKSCTVYIA